MTWDEARDLSLEVEIVEADDVDPENVWTPEDLDEAAERAEFEEWIRTQPERPDEISDFERYLDSLTEKTEEDHYS